MTTLTRSRAARQKRVGWWALSPLALVAVVVAASGVGLMGAISGPATSAAAAQQDNAANGSCTVTANPTSVRTTRIAEVSTGSTPQTDPANVDGIRLDATQVQNAQIIVGVGKSLTADITDMAAALAVAYTDSKLDANASSAGGIGAGIFLQTSQLYNGINRNDPVAAATAWFKRLLAQEDANGNLSFTEAVLYMQSVATETTAAQYEQAQNWATALATLLNEGTQNPGGGFAVTCVGGAGDNTTFDPGNIISDAVFYHVTSMTVPQIRAFIALQDQPCPDTNQWCLKNLKLTTPPEPADQYCAAYPGGHDQDAATVIAAFSLACGINPQVMLTTLQKESQGLTRANPTQASYDAAWGWNCPDTGPGGTAHCDPSAAGFFNQGYNMAKQWAKYRQRIPTGYYPYQVGKTADILWNVAESGCGSGPVTIANVATASMYVYTPYQPNAASLAAYPGEGDRCSSYGNRNFFYLFRQYFGSTGGGRATSPTVQGPITVDGVRITLPSKAGITGTITAPTPTVAKAITAGLHWLGEPYSWGGGSPAGPTLGICGPNGAENDCNIIGFDCSGLMMYLWAQVGISISHYSQDQFTAGTQIPWNKKQPGDMIGYDGHIAMYIGTFNGTDYMLEAPESGEYVHITPVRNNPDRPHYATVSRVWTGH